MIYKKKLHKLKYYYATPTPSENYLNNFYSHIYFKKKTTHQFSKKYSNIELENKKKRAQHIIDFLLNYVGKKKHLLDIGSGEGFLLRAAKNKNFKILGVDYSNFAIKKFNKNILNILLNVLRANF
jgi:cyclopropane fatty-acyl-phospholipid synthase-like methyltransferase